MLSKDDYKNYMEQIIQLENKMSYLYKECSDKLEEGYAKKLCSGLLNAEKQHALIVKELIGLFDV